MIRHIRVAVGRDYNDLPPVSGFYESVGGARRMAYELEVILATQDGDELTDKVTPPLTT